MQWERRSSPLRAAFIATALVLLVGLISAPASAAPASWALTTTPVRTGGTTLWFDTSCVGTTSCMIVGVFSPTDGSAARAISGNWNGSTWSTALASKQGTQPLAFTGVSCVSVAFCVAIGNRQHNGQYLPIAERWNGKVWRSMSFPSVRGTVPVLTGVSCWSTTGCAAVGWSPSGAWRVPITERWGGAKWVRDAAANPTGLAQLNDVACTALDDCEAVGSSLSASGFATLIEHWDGVGWTVVASPNVGSEHIDLVSVSCSAGADCVATGWWSYSSGPPLHQQGPKHTLVEHWDGTSWSVVASPDSPSDGNELTEVTCTAATDCVAAGAATSDSTGSRQPLVEQWDGSQWTIVSVPSPGDFIDVPFGLSCGSASACFVLGFSSNAGVTSSFGITGS